MNDSSGHHSTRIVAQEFLATVWPVSLPSDSEMQRRQKLAVRAGQLAMAVMVLAAVAGAIAADFRLWSTTRIAALALVGIIYIVWSLHGLRDAVRFLLLDRGAATMSLWRPGRRVGAVLYFAVQLGLAGLLYGLGVQGRGGPLLWLVLLPPVAHSVILLPRFGIAVVSLLTMAVMAFDLVWWYGWEPIPNVLLQFSFAVLFTLVFTLLAVSSEKARQEVQWLAGELGDANRKLREYAVQAEELAATRERNRLAREIHDSLGHYLTVVNVQIEAARAVRDHDPVRARDALDKAQALTQEGLQEIRRSVAALRASPLDNKSLADALRQIVDESRAAGLATEMQVLGEARTLSPQAELTLYRAGQEGLTNVRKHAGVPTARVVLDFRTPAKARLSVSDAGAGAAPGAEGKGGFGLLGVRERTQLLGGEVRVRTTPGAGFTLEVEVPG
ncbi:MAG: sensor histidine kinase [Verrucomicrobia bacterium]|nr:sensor histidine kinase [Verrucomicrobiota bacterium]